MSAHTADSKYSFDLPKLSYIDAKWEEPNLRASAAAVGTAGPSGLAAWLSRKLAAFLAWRRDRAAIAELSAMTAYELQDIGLTRSDIGRVFISRSNADLRESR